MSFCACAISPKQVAAVLLHTAYRNQYTIAHNMSFSTEERGNPNTLSYRLYFSKYEFCSSEIDDEEFVRSGMFIELRWKGLGRKSHVSLFLASFIT